jgi:hypothetical protein
MLDYIMKYNNTNGGGLRESYWYCGIVADLQRKNILPH